MLSVFYSNSDYITDYCPGYIGPTEGEVLSYHAEAKGRWMVPTTHLDCWIILRGMPTKQGGEKRYVRLSFRKFKMSGFIDTSTNDTCTC